MEKTFTGAKWSAHAETYTSVFGSLTYRWAVDSLQVAHHEILRKLQHHASEMPSTPFHFLDVGCGPGTLSLEFARRYLSTYMDTRITASDFSEKMLEQLTEALENDPTLRPFRAAITPLQADGMLLASIPNASIDAIGSNFGCSIFPDRNKSWAVAHRVLKDDGLLVVTAWSDKSSQMVWFDKLTDIFNATGGGGEPLKYPSLVVATDREKVLKELQAAGFRHVKSYCTTHTIVFDNLGTVVQASMNNPFAAKFLERLTKEQMEVTLTNLMEEDSQKNAYCEEGSATTDSGGIFVDDGCPRLISFSAFTILARK
uniref:Methyltransferase type 11 domain-containing protein n=1 Tax=Hyaloperonospora arabidopsidis (strain Emoy2) TaxID=559515 RepID=M4C534_HYAAE